MYKPDEDTMIEFEQFVLDTMAAGKETIKLGDLEYLFPEIFESARDRLKNEVG